MRPCSSRTSKPRSNGVPSSTLPCHALPIPPWQRGSGVDHETRPEEPLLRCTPPGCWKAPVPEQWLTDSFFHICQVAPVSSPPGPDRALSQFMKRSSFFPCIAQDGCPRGWGPFLSCRSVRSHFTQRHSGLSCTCRKTGGATSSPQETDTFVVKRSRRGVTRDPFSGNGLAKNTKTQHEPQKLEVH